MLGIHYFIFLKGNVLELCKIVVVYWPEDVEGIEKF